MENRLFKQKPRYIGGYIDGGSSSSIVTMGK